MLGPEWFETNKIVTHTSRSNQLVFDEVISKLWKKAPAKKSNDNPLASYIVQKRGRYLNQEVHTYSNSSVKSNCEIIFNNILYTKVLNHIDSII